MHRTADLSMSNGLTETRAADGPSGPVNMPGLAVIDDLMAGGGLLPTQLPVATNLSPEKKLAAAVFASALIEIRDHHGNPAHRRGVAEAIEWVQSDDGEWPFSFLRICDVFDLEPEWVRREVQQWIDTPREARKPFSFLYRQAA
jgi:hypothetical protein